MPFKINHLSSFLLIKDLCINTVVTAYLHTRHLVFITLGVGYRETSVLGRIPNYVW